ncbi:hypothetical protein MAA_10742 [Metarhizium robertsii ARSEF 23]|uniref:Nephrocystin 3-like N-terminal domain-containing protein n=1 Tax=Metarhizium robertsii (strain ARSEF 23 / ATCC MYA-3075) TaxID=655844 RepID=A0A0B2XAB0_METRA|nr:uncharacterized protein MAA_10742 [Metarhizium robertsii ARSEF 23]KHO11798.1 hypothetical protein MAA_10742 [Metarhizium robertsii ARSEF 23]
MSYTYGDYTVGLICTSPIELAASTLMLDEKHPALRPRSLDGFTLGQIGQHNIVIIWLGCGEENATAVTWAENKLLHDFPNIRFVLMAGFGGGAPTTPSDDPNKDIRLGDVVVGHSEGNYGGVLKYGREQVFQEGEFTQRDFFNKPPAILTDAVSELRAKSETVRSAISRHISDILTLKPGLRPKFQYQGHEHDELFEEDFQHKGEEGGCEMCDKERLVHREPRDTNDPVIHYGIIGSGPQDIWNSSTRERFRREQGILCLETMAYGLMPDVPCLVIRGICHYSDSHRNERWQRYAAATAAAYAKELLQIIPAGKVAPAEEELGIMKQKQQRKERDDILDLIISSPTYEEQHAEILQQRQPGTGQWFLESPEFTMWLGGEYQGLYCPGAPGTGKTVLASIAIEHIRAQPGRRSPVAFIYCNSKSEEEQTIKNLLGMVLHQFLSQCTSIPESVKEVFEKPMIIGRELVTLDIFDAITRLVDEEGPAYLVIDALDQCSDPVREALLTYVCRLQIYTDTRVMTTSRPMESIETSFPRDETLLIRADPGDVECYLDGRLSTLPQCVRDDADLWKEVKARIIEAANGSFPKGRYYLTFRKE